VCGCIEQQVAYFYHDCGLRVKMPGKRNVVTNRPDYCPTCGQCRAQYVVFCPGCSTITTYPYVKPGRIPPSPFQVPTDGGVVKVKGPKPAKRKPKQ
jgi:hypothetical protein